MGEALETEVNPEVNLLQIPETLGAEAGEETLGPVAGEGDDFAGEAAGNDVAGVSLIELAEILDAHKMWVETGGEAGISADLSGANLANADLTGVNLQGAILHKANLSGADLSMANLKGANLVHADLGNAILLGTELRGANLMGATLYGAEGLWAGRLGGANLFDAILPDSVAEFNSTNAITQASKVARAFYFLTLTVSAICCLLIVFTTDVRLLLNGSALPFSRIANVLPMTGFYLGGPILLLALYLRFHFVLLRLWASMAALPAVFPDGETPERDGPWFLMGLIRRHFRWVREGRSPISMVESVVSTLLGYWVVPATLFLFWLRYLVRQDLRGTLMQVVLVVAAVAGATCLPTVVSRVLRPGDIRRARSRNFIRMVLFTTRAALITGGVMLILSVGVNRGLPADRDAAPQQSAAHIMRWASRVFQLVGYRPYADLTEAALSTPPAHGNWTEEALEEVPGVRLNQMNLRFARSYRGFLVNGKLWRANLEGAYLSEADLRGANLREAVLNSAVLDRAKANRAVFVSAEAIGANFSSADLGGADLSYGNFENANLSNAKFNGASMYGINLNGAKMLRTELPRADLRDSKLEHSTLSFANFQEADLSSAKLASANLTGAQLKGTILLDADLKNTNLQGALMTGTLLRGADMTGANLAGANLQGAVGLTPTQICSAHWQGVMADADLLAEVQTRCGTPGAALAAPAAGSAPVAAAPTAAVAIPAAQTGAAATGPATPSVAAAGTTSKPTPAASPAPKPAAHN